MAASSRPALTSAWPFTKWSWAAFILARESATLYFVLSGFALTARENIRTARSYSSRFISFSPIR